MRRALVLIALLMLPAAAAAQDPRPFCAERPGKATPPCILDAGRWQVESGIADVATQRGGGSRDDLYVLGATELRFGLMPRAEAEIGWAPLIVDHVHGAGRRTGVGDLSLGGRVALTDPDAEGLAVSAGVVVNAPTATHGLGAGGWTGGARLPLAIPLTDTLAFGATPEVDVVRDAGRHGVHLAWSAAAGLSRGFGDLTLGAELWGLADQDPSGHTRQASFDLTAAHMLGPNAQLDAGVNLGITRATPDVEGYIGIARRF